MCCKQSNGFRVVIIAADEYGNSFSYFFKNKENGIKFLTEEGFVDWTVDPEDPHFLHFINTVYRPDLDEEELKTRFYLKKRPSETAFIEEIQFEDEEEHHELNQ